MQSQSPIVTATVDANFDGTVFRPLEPVALPPNTPVRLTVEVLPAEPESPASFLKTAMAQKLNGPPDWASNLDDYLYGEKRP